MRKEDLENLNVTGNIGGKGDRGSQRATYLTSLCKWLSEQAAGALAKVEKLLRVAMDRKLMKTLMTCVLNGQVTYKMYLE